MDPLGAWRLERYTLTRFGVSAIALAWAAALVVDAGHPKVTEAVSDVGLSVAPLLAAYACWRASRNAGGRIRAFWLLVGASVFSWSMGHVAWIWYEAVRGKALETPWLGDVGYLCAVPLAAVGMLILPAGTQAIAGRVRTLIDGWMIAGAALLTSWVFVLHTVLAHETDRVAHAISVLYPIGDVVVVTTVLYVMLRIRQTGLRPAAPVGVVGAALLLIAFSDSAFAYLSSTGAYRPGSGVDIGWFGGFALLLFAALRPAPPEEAARDAGSYRPTGMFLPSFAVAAALGSSAFELFRTGTITPFVSWVRTAIILAVIVRLVLTMRENRSLTERLEAKVRDLHASEQRFEALVQHSSEIVTVLDQQGIVTYQSESIQRVFGYSPADVVGTDLGVLFTDTSAVQLADALGDVSTEPGAVRVLELEVRDAKGRFSFAELTMTNLLDEPAVAGVVLNTRDVSERKLLQDRLLHEASHDSLTALANRSLFRDRVQGNLRRNDSRIARVTILFLDLDGFKEVNDSLGHGSGDALLVQVAQRLRTCVRPVDTVARLGGDEFAVLIADKSSERDGRAVAERIQESLETPFRLDGRELYIGASIGIAATDHEVKDADHLLRNADLAMYRAKAKGKGGFERYDPRFHAALVERLELEGELRQAIAAGGLDLHYQPAVSLATRNLRGIEALARWKHPLRGFVPPGEFVPLAEQTGLVCDLGRWVLREACRQLAEWLRRFPEHGDLIISVNISGRHFDELSLIDDVREALDASGLAPERLMLEITESVLMVRTQDSVQSLARLKALGVRLAIDDFGTGYSSLAYLDRFPIDVIKIDRSFVERIGGSPSDAELLRTIVRLAHRLGKATVAEGVEDETQMNTLQAMGCEFAQGFYFHRPMPAGQLERLLECEPVGQAPTGSFDGRAAA